MDARLSITNRVDSIGKPLCMIYVNRSKKAVFNKNVDVAETELHREERMRQQIRWTLSDTILSKGLTRPRRAYGQLAGTPVQCIG
jgi:hypothetical protein